MENHRNPAASAYMAGISSFLLTALFLTGAAAQGQQSSKLTASYSKAALLAVTAIESDTSARQDESSEDMEIATTQAIDATGEKAMTSEEKAFTETLREIYELKRHDNSILRAYRIVMEVENAEDASDNVYTRQKKDYAVSQFADGQAEITDSEGACFKELKQSLAQRSPDAASCSQWIQKAKRQDKDSGKTGESDSSPSASLSGTDSSTSSRANIAQP
jgi:hypothetical protein